MYKIFTIKKKVYKAHVSFQLQCDQLCGEGKQRRVVLCHQKNNGRVELYDDSVCAGEKPATEQTCLLHPCEGVDWVLTEWTGVSD